MRKMKLLFFVLLLFCCIGGCGKNEGNMKEIQFQEIVGDQNINPVQTQDYETTPETKTDSAGVKADADETRAAYSENGKPVDRIIAEQSFEVELDSWGTVTFVSIAPAENKGTPEFALAKAGEIVYRFPKDDVVRPDEFVAVDAVAFSDYNNDGKTDVITLNRYRSGSEERHEARIFLQENTDNMFYLDNPELKSYRRDAQTDQGTAFYEDCLLEEYLLTQGLTDTIASVKGTWTNYISYVDGLEGIISRERQLELLAESRDIWADPVEYADDRYCFTVRDLNYDGRLELIVANQGGTGHYTYSRFYGLDADGNLKELETTFMEGDSQPDIIEEQLTVYRSFSSAGIQDYYIVYDELRAAPDNYVYRISSLALVNGCIIETPLASQTITYEGENLDAHTVSVDYNNNALTEEEFQNYPDTHYGSMGLEKETVTLHWIDVSALAGKSDGEVAEMLRQEYS